MTDTRSSSVVVLGGGLFGLKAAYDISSRGESVCVIEQEETTGGLCRSFQFDDLVFDVGPHLFYTGFEQGRQDIHSEYTRLLGYEPVSLKNRIAESLMLTQSGHLTYHPLRIAHVLARFGPVFAARAARDLVRHRLRRSRTAPGNASELLINAFGATLFDEAFASYMQKSCDLPLAEIDMRWVTERDYVLGKKGLLNFLLASVMRRRQAASGHVYSASGGSQAIPDAYAQELRKRGARILLGTQVTGIIAEADRIQAVEVHGPDGRHTIKGDRFISSIPLPELTRLLQPAVGTAIRTAADALSFRRLTLIFMRYNHPVLRNAPQIYLGTDRTQSKRLSEPKQLCAALGPACTTGLCWEVCCDDGPLWQASDDELFALAKQDLIATGLSTNADDIEGVAIRRVEHAYPIYRKGFDQHRSVLLKYLERFQNLISGGRQGQFKYNIYTNQTWELAAEAARQILRYP